MTKRLTYKQVKELEIFLDSLPKLNAEKPSKKSVRARINKQRSLLQNEPKYSKKKI